ncbi:MAG: 3-dehydroquinate synthase, partial [Clostridia bacterium]|nr:3-dehydroquinate synthase [Clostridia bacterium]
MNLRVGLGERSYDITIERGVLARAPELLDLKRKVMIVTDTGVPAAYPAAVSAYAEQPAVFVLEQGEQSKNFDNLQRILSVMTEAGFDRGDCVAAVGGGV